MMLIAGPSFNRSASVRLSRAKPSGQSSFCRTASRIAGNHFRRGAGDGRAIAGLFRILARLCRQAGQAEMLSQKLWLRASDFRESLFQMAPTGFVKTAPLREKEAFVGSVA